jgi:hypothetical protein
MNHLDDLETRRRKCASGPSSSTCATSSTTRSATRRTSPKLLADVPAHGVPDRAALAQLPVTRKSDLIAAERPAAVRGD